MKNKNNFFSNLPLSFSPCMMVMLAVICPIAAASSTTVVNQSERPIAVVWKAWGCFKVRYGHVMVCHDEKLMPGQTASYTYDWHTSHPYIDVDIQPVQADVSHGLYDVLFDTGSTTTSSSSYTSNWGTNDDPFYVTHHNSETSPVYATKTYDIPVQNIVNLSSLTFNENRWLTDGCQGDSINGTIEVRDAKIQPFGINVVKQNDVHHLDLKEAPDLNGDFWVDKSDTRAKIKGSCSFVKR